MRRGLATLHKRLLTSLFVAIFIVATAASSMHRATAAEASGQGIQISPVIIDLNGEKGGSYNLRLTVTNVTAGTLVLRSSVNDFKAGGESGTPQVILKDDTTTNEYSLKNWVGTIPNITLASKESRSLTFAVTIPASAEAGGHYGVIRFSGVPPELKDANVSLTASVGLLLLARVEGKITESLSVKTFTAQKNGKQSGLFATGPVDLVARIENTGNVHVKPVGTMTVKDSFGKVVATYPFGSNNKNVLPHSIRAYSQTFDKRWLFGRYTASLQAAYGTTGAVLIGSTSFWVIPIQFILFASLAVIASFLILRRLLGHYNRHVIRRAQNPKHKH